MRAIPCINQSWWLFPTHLKNMLVKLGSSSPIFGVKTKKYLKPPPSDAKASWNVLSCTFADGTAAGGFKGFDGTLRSLMSWGLNGSLKKSFHSTLCIRWCCRDCGSAYLFFVPEFLWSVNLWRIFCCKATTLGPQPPSGFARRPVLHWSLPILPPFLLQIWHPSQLMAVRNHDVLHVHIIYIYIYIYVIF